MRFHLLLLPLLVALVSGDSLSAQEAVLKTKFTNIGARDLRPSGEEDPEISFFEKAANVSGKPVILSVSIHVLDISEIDDDDQELKVTLYLRHKWNDPRHVYSSSGTEMEDIIMTEPNRIWVPDTFFVNERQGRLHDVATKNVFIRIKPNGDIHYSARYSVKLACPMDHSRFPFDKQICSMRLESYGYDMKDVIYLWQESDTFTIGKDMNVKPFMLEGYGYDYCNSKLTQGEYSCLRADLLLARKGATRAVLQAYLPLGVLLLLTYLTLVCPVRRGSRILSATVLFLLTLLAAPFVLQLTPDTRDSTALDCWAIWCVALAALPPLIIAFAAAAERRQIAAQKARGYETCAEDGNKTLELLSPPFIDSEKEESNGADLSAAQAISAGITRPPPCKSRCPFARYGITGDKIERWFGIIAFILVVVFLLAHGLTYGIDNQCYQSLTVEKKFPY